MQILINILICSTLILIVSSSFSFIYYPTKFFHIVHAVIIALGAYLTFLFLNQLSLPLPIAIILGITLATLIGISCEVFVYKPMRKRNMQLWHYLIASIGLYVILQNLISLFFGDDTKVLRAGDVTVGHEIFGAHITSIQIITIFVSLILFFAVNLFLNKTHLGKSIKAVSNNPELSNIYGINSNRVIHIAFAIGSAIAAVAGILSAMDTNMTPTFGFNLLLYGVIAMIIGGIGSTKGLIAGSFLLASAQHLGAYYIDTKWMDAIAFIILIIFLIWKPLGFSGMRLKKVEV